MSDKKLRRKARRLARWAMRHGYDYVSIAIFAPNEQHPDEWYSNITTTTPGKEGYHDVSEFMKEGLDG